MTTGNPSARRIVRRPHIGLLADQCAAILVAVVFLALGILGFVPGATEHVDAMTAAGHRSGALLFGTFQVSLAQNLIHIAFGVAGLLLARSFASARLYLLGGGALCLGLWLYGLLIAYASPANALSLNNADNWLHFGLGVAMVIFGVTLAGTRVPTGAGGEELLPPD